MTDMHRRAVLRGTAITAMAAAGAAPSTARPDVMAPHLNGRASGTIPVVPDRATLAALPSPSAGQVVFLSEGARAGLFTCVAGTAPADPQQGLYIPSTTSGFHFERVRDGSHGRPEWFGAIVNDDRADCAGAIEACYAACAVTELAHADYFIRRTLHLDIAYRTVRGCGTWGAEPGQGTRIVLHRASPGIHTDHIMVVGTVEKPGNDGVWENHCSNFTLVRDGACTPHASRDPARYPAGLYAAHLVRCTFRDIASRESSVGIYLGAVVYTRLDDCAATRLNRGTSKDGDFWIGYYLDGLAQSGYLGGNASLYIDRCVAVDQHSDHVDPVGLLARGAFVDTYIDRFESARIASGATFQVAGRRGYGEALNLHLRNAVLDGVTKAGLAFDLDGTATASIEVIDLYVAAAGGTGAETGLSIQGGAGLFTITGGQLLNTFRKGAIYISQTWGVRVQGTKIHQSVRPVVVDGAGGLLLEPQINNYLKESPDPAVDCRGLSRSILRPVLVGASVAFRTGISLDATSQHVEVDGSGLHHDCLPAPFARNKVWYDGGDARDGKSGAAFLAAGNRLVGVTD